MAPAMGEKLALLPGASAWAAPHLCSLLPLSPQRNSPWAEGAVGEPLGARHGQGMAGVQCLQDPSNRQGSRGLAPEMLCLWIQNNVQAVWRLGAGWKKRQGQAGYAGGAACLNNHLSLWWQNLGLEQSPTPGTQQGQISQMITLSKPWSSEVSPRHAFSD